MDRHLFSKIEFYITNVCNLTCEDCNRFNNHSFAGWQKWSDYEALYEKWAEYIDIDHMVILGGEPLLNPDIINWVYGLNRIWKTNVQILSNGTRLNNVKGLYEALQINGNWIGISWHNPNTIHEFEAEVCKFLHGTITKSEKNDSSNRFGADIMWKDQNGVSIPLWLQYDFYPSAVIPNNGTFTLHNSDPKQAHDVCGFVRSKCYHMIQGKLYKCGPVALFPEFDQQNKFDISDEDRQLLNSYKPLLVETYTELGKQFIETLDQVIDQCKFCSGHMSNKQIFAVSKKEAKKKYTLDPV